MKAWKFAVKYGERIIGKKVMTKPYGSWPGGPCVVIRIDEDDELLAFTVKPDGWMFGKEDDDAIGIFADEDVEELEEEPKAKQPIKSRKITFKL